MAPFFPPFRCRPGCGRVAGDSQFFLAAWHYKAHRAPPQGEGSGLCLQPLYVAAGDNRGDCLVLDQPLRFKPDRAPCGAIGPDDEHILPHYLQVDYQRRLGKRAHPFLFLDYLRDLPVPILFLAAFRLIILPPPFFFWLPGVPPSIPACMNWRPLSVRAWLRSGFNSLFRWPSVASWGRAWFTSRFFTSEGLWHDFRYLTGTWTHSVRSNLKYNFIAVV